jgi:hypothetical protein
MLGGDGSLRPSDPRAKTERRWSKKSTSTLSIYFVPTRPRRARNGREASALRCTARRPGAHGTGNCRVMQPEGRAVGPVSPAENTRSASQRPTRSLVTPGVLSGDHSSLQEHPECSPETHAVSRNTRSALGRPLESLGNTRSALQRLVGSPGTPGVLFGDCSSLRGTPGVFFRRCLALLGALRVFLGESSGLQEHPDCFFPTDRVSKKHPECSRETHAVSRSTRSAFFPGIRGGGSLDPASGATHMNGRPCGALSAPGACIRTPSGTLG